jgi:hypothetical protein
MKRKVILAVILSFFLLWAVFFLTDHLRTMAEKTPVFALETNSYDDGGSKKYTGLLYNVYYLHFLNPAMTEGWFNPDNTLKDEYRDQEYVTGYEIAPWFVSIDQIKKKYQ